MKRCTRMRQVFLSGAAFKILRRCMCSENGKQNLKEMSKNLKTYLSESPLKNINEPNEWATTPYPTGTNLSTSENKDSVNIDPETTSIVMFPGQGAQYVGMGKSLLVHSVVQDMFDAASSILGYDLKKICLSGPKSKLDDTEYSQPAVLVCSLAAVEELKMRYPLAISNCAATCGFSLGEIAALVFAGCITFEDAVKITRVRALEMKKCSQEIPSCMATVLYSADSKVKDAMENAKRECYSAGILEPICEVANYLFPECKVIAGHAMAIRYIEQNKVKYKLRKVVKLPVSGAFHTKIMENAAVPFGKILDKLDIKEPLVPVLSNVLGRPYNSVGEIRKYLPRQIYKPVKWEQILHYVYSRKQGTKFPQTYECGPGCSLSAVLKRVNFLAFQNCHQIEA